MKQTRAIAAFLLFSLVGFSLSAELPPRPTGTTSDGKGAYTDPIPLKSKSGDSPINVNSVIFFEHPVVPGSDASFKESPSRVILDGLTQFVSDVAGAPGADFNTTTSELGMVNLAIDKMLADPLGLCHEDFLTLACPRSVLTDTSMNTTSWFQFVGDVRQDSAGGIIFEGGSRFAPYQDFTLGSVIASTSESPPAICYDIAQGDDWLACPVFGMIQIQLSKTKTYFVRLQSPVLIYRIDDDSLYHLAGYLTSPSLKDLISFPPDSAADFRESKPFFPVAIAVGDFTDPSDIVEAIPALGMAITVDPNTLGTKDMVVMSTSSLLHSNCANINLLLGEKVPADSGLAAKGYGKLPWGLECSDGIGWIRSKKDWGLPVRRNFDSFHRLVSGPKVYDLATGSDQGKNVLFAPSNAIAEDGYHYVLKYYEEGYLQAGTGESYKTGVLIFPKLIPVRSPASS
ncbi:MAG: hypothetical protein Q7S68_02955, partial [Deltaproteobacteria bacterium]|nr:hypothetical protein [Deltaproteobacteria bacterium]